MGLFSFIGSIGSAIVSGISKIASSIAPTVISFAKTAFKAATTVFTSLSKVGGFIGSIASSASKLFSGISTLVAGPLGSIVGQIATHLIITAISKAIEWLARKMEIISQEDKVEEVGYRVEEAAKHEEWQKREDFDSFAEYNNYLKNKIPSNEIDRNKLESNRLTYRGLGMTALSNGLEAKFGLEMPIDFLIEIGRCKLNGIELNNLIEEFSAKGYNLSLFREYLQGNLTGDMNRAVYSVILDSLKKVYPEKDESDLTAQITSMKKASRDDVEMLKNYEAEFEAITKNQDISEAEKIIFDEVAKSDKLG